MYYSRIIPNLGGAMAPASPPWLRHFLYLLKKEKGIIARWFPTPGHVRDCVEEKKRGIIQHISGVRSR